MKHIKRLSALLVALTCLFSLFSCQKEIEPEGGRGYLLVDGKQTDPEWVLKLDDTPVSFDEYRHFYLNAKTDLDAGKEDFFTEHPEAAADLKETVLDYLKKCRATELVAAENGIVLTDAEEKEIRDQKAATREELGDELYASMLSDYRLTEEMYLEQLTNNKLYEKTYNWMVGEGGKIHVSEDELYEYLNENYFCFAQIYLDFRKGEGTNTHEATDKIASDAMGRLEAGEDFFSVAFSLSDDQTMLDYKNGYLKKKNLVSEEKAAVLETLEPGELSEPLLTGEGYFIFWKMPIAEEIVKENRDYVLNGYTDPNSNHVNGLYDDRFADLIAARAEKITVTFADCYESITPDTVF